MPEVMMLSNDVSMFQAFYGPYSEKNPNGMVSVIANPCNLPCTTFLILCNKS